MIVTFWVIKVLNLNLYLSALDNGMQFPCVPGVTDAMRFTSEEAAEQYLRVCLLTGLKPKYYSIEKILCKLKSSTGTIASNV